MANFEAVSKKSHQHKLWKLTNNFRFTAHDSICTLTMHEIPKAALHMPIAFCRIGGSFELIAVQGLEPDCNYLVDSSGNWLGGYIPELYQNYPFSLASSDNQQVLCIDTDSDLISDNEGYPFFFDDQPSSEIQEILKSLSKFTSNHLITKQMCKMLEQFELLEIWPISVVV